MRVSMIREHAACLALALFAGCANGGTAVAPPTISPESSDTAAPLSIRLGAEQNVVKLGTWGTRWIPDERMTYYTASDGTSDFWWAGGTVVGPGETLAMSTRDFFHFTPRILDRGNAVASLLPNHPGSQAPDADYAGPGSVFRSHDGRDLLMIYHGENHLFGGIDYPGTPFYATICLARSHDGGLTWHREGGIIDGMQPKPPSDPPRPAMGAGNPSAIIVGGYIYVYYVDLGFNTGPDLTHVARAPVASDGAPGSWRKWYDGSFSQPGIGGKSTPVMGRPNPGAKTVWAANGIVSYNTYLHSYLNVFQTAIGFYYATSADLLHWKIRGEIFAFAHDEDAMKHGWLWYSYPSFLSPGEPDDRTTDRSGFLYYAKARWDVAPHTMYRRALSFTAVAGRTRASP
jgi:hypothetical protein